MEKQTPYPGMTKKEYEELLKRSKVLSTFVNEKYVSQYESMIRELEEQHRRNAKKLAKDNIMIGNPIRRVRKKWFFSWQRHIMSI